MSRVRGKNTTPEITVRRLVHRMGFRYRLHVADLPGKPDMVFPKLGKIVFVHGCFWHQHPGCGRQPKSKLGFWASKLSKNRERDLRNQQKLRRFGWRILIVWECDGKQSTTELFSRKRKSHENCNQAEQIYLAATGQQISKRRGDVCRPSAEAPRRTFEQRNRN